MLSMEQIQQTLQELADTTATIESNTYDTIERNRSRLQDQIERLAESLDDLRRTVEHLLNK